MHRKTSLWLLVLLLLSILLTTPNLTHTAMGSSNEFQVLKSYWKTLTGREVDPEPGEIVYLVVELRKISGPAQVGGIYGVVTFSDSNITGVTGESSVRYDYPSTVSTGGMFDLEFKVKLNESCSLGNHTIQLTIGYHVHYSNNVPVVSKHSETHTFNVTVRGRPKISVELLNTTLIPGLNNVTLKLVNNGHGNGTNLEVDLSTTPPASLISTSKRELGSIVADKTIESSSKYAYYLIYIPYPVTVTTNSLQVSISYYTESGVKETETKIVSYIVNSSSLKKPDVEIKASPTELSPDKVNLVTLTVRNNGEVAAADLEIALTTTGVSLLNGSRYKIDQLKPGDSAQYSIQVYVPYSIRGSSLTISSSISYSFNEFSEVKTSYLGFKIKESVVPEVGNETAFKISGWKWVKNGLETAASPGDVLTLSVEIAFQLREKISNVYVKIYPPEGIVVTNKEYFYPGVLSPGMVFNAVFNDVKIAGGVKPGNYSFRAEVGYKLLYYPLLEGSLEPSMIIERNHSETYNFSVEVSGKPDVTIDVNPRKLVSDKVNYLKLTVRNKGSATARDLEIELTTSQTSILNGSKYKIDKLNPNESASYWVTVFIPHSIRGSPLTLTSTLNYRFGRFSETKVNHLGLRVSEEVEVEGSNRSIFEISSVKWVKNGLETVASPGDVLTLSVEVVFHFEERVSSVYVKIYPPRGILVGEDKYFYQGTLSPGSVFTAFFENVKISENLDVGMYPLRVEVGYEVLHHSLLKGSPETSVMVKREYSEIHNASLSILGRPDLRQFADKSELSAGRNIVFIYLENTGYGVARNLKVSLKPQGQVSVLTNQTFNISKLKAGDRVNFAVELYVPPTLGGSSYTLPISFEYEDSLGNEYVDSRSLGFEVKPVVKPDVNLEVEPKTLTVGSRELTVNLIALNDVVRNLKISYYSADIAIIGAQERSIGDLSKGEERSFNISVFIPITGKAGEVLKLNFNAEYDDVRGTHYVKAQTVTLIGKGQADLEILDLSIYPKKPTPGETFSMSLTILNTGTDDAKELFARALYSENVFTPAASTSIYVGDVRTGVPSPISFSFTVNSNTPSGRYNISVEMVYKDSLGEKHTYSMDIPVNVAGKTPQTTEESQYPIKGWFLTALILAITAASITVALLVWRRRK